MIRSMTAFSSATGASHGQTRQWEIRSVNGRGRDVKLRLADLGPAMEARLRKIAADRITRGNVTIGLRYVVDADTGTALDPEALDAALQTLRQVEERATSHGVSLAPTTAAALITMPGVRGAAPAAEPLPEDALDAEFTALMEAFDAMRQAEGAALQAVLSAQVDQIETLTAQAASAAEARRPGMRLALQRALDAAAEGRDIPEDRIAQELALLAVKSDVTEELDRLAAHVVAARDLLGQGGAVGRRLDFLAQEFNREANTLCSKSGDPALTAIGLDLKSVIDQMREQIQNVE